MSFSSSYLEKRKKRLKEREKQLDNKFNNDIAPVGGNKDSWFKGGALSDGYEFGDITKTILGTAGDASLSIVKGVGRMVEGLTDVATYGVAGVADLFGADSFAEDARDVAKFNATDEFTAPVTDYVDRFSLSGNKFDSVSEGIGQVATILLTGGAAGAAGLGTAGVTAVTTGVTGLSSMGSGMSQAYTEGATDEEAATYGLIAGVAEAGTELLFGGLGKAVGAVGLSKGISSLDDALAKKVSSKIANHTMKNFAEFGIKAGAEGTEEVISGILQAFGKKATYMSEEELGKLLKDEELLDSFIVGTITSGITQSGIVPKMKKGSLIEANKQGADFITGHTETEQKVIDRVVESNVAEREQELGRKLKAKERAEIEEDVETKLIKGGISIDTIEETLGGDSYKAYKEATEKQEALKKELDELRNMKKGEMTDIQTDRLTELKAMNLEDTSKVDELKAKASQDVFELIKADRKGQGSILAESYNERARRGVAFEVDTDKVDSKKADTYKRAMEAGVLNNTNATHDFVDLVATLEAEKGVKIDFSNNEKLKTSGFAVDGAEINGVKTDGGIILNANSRKNLNVVVGHEITHILEGTELYTALKDTIISYAKSKGDYDARYKATSKLYEKVKDADIDGEITADLVGEYLFTDEKFIKSLTTNKNLFQKVYDEIKYLVKAATAGSAEKKQLLKVQRAFEKAFETSKMGGEEREKYRKSKMTTAEIAEEIQSKRNKVVDEVISGKYKYSLSDSNYLKAVESGDMATAQRMVDEAAKANGYTIKGMHATNAEFTEFDISKTSDINYHGRGIYFTNSLKDVENNYENYEAPDPWQKVEAEAYELLYDKYGYSYEDTLTSDSEVIDKLNECYDEVIDKFKKTLRRVTAYLKFDNPLVIGKHETASDYDMSQYDGIIDKHVYETIGHAGMDENTIHYIVLNPKNIKSAEAVTYDDNGNVIPLSERFKSDNNDIRYSLSEMDEDLDRLLEELLTDEDWRDMSLFGGDVSVDDISIEDISEELNVEPEKIEILFRRKGLGESHIEAGRTAVMKQARIDEAIEDSGAKFNPGYARKYITRISPKDFIDLTVLQNHVDRGQFDNEVKGDHGSTMSEFDYEKALQDSRRSPYLHIDRSTGRVISHNGRHRIRALEMAGIESVEIEVEFYDEDGYLIKYNADTIPDMAISSQFDTGIETHLSNIIPLNEAHRTEIEGTYGEKAHPDAGVKYSLSEIVAEDGTSYGIGVKLDSTLLDNLDPKDRVSLIKEYVRELQGKVFTAFDEDGEPVDISIAEGNKRFRNNKGNRVATNKDLTTKYISKETKQEAIALIDELISTATYQGSEAARHPHDWLDNDGKNDWDMWTTYIQDKNNTIWEATLHIANTTNGEKILYDISLIKKAEQSGKSDTSLLTLGQSGESDTIPDDNSIAPLTENVKRDAKFSLSEDIAPVDNTVDNVDIDPVGIKYSDIVEQTEASETEGRDARGKKGLAAAYDKIDKQFKADKASLDKEFKKRKKNALAKKNEKDRNAYIAHLEERYAMKLAELTEQVKREKELAKKESERVRRKDLHNSIIEAIKTEYTTRGLDFDKVLDEAKRKGTFASVDNTPQRFIEKTLGYKAGQILNDLTVNKIALNESAGIEWLNGQVDNIRKLSKKYNIKPGSKESAAAQMYGEGFYVNKQGEYVKYGDAELAKDFPSIEVQNNIKALAKNTEVRRMYDETLEAINASRVRNGYPEIPKREDYFLHFRAMDDTFSRLGIPFNPNDIKAKDLPTDINGMTADLKPGQPYFASANRRMGIKTTYDLLGGIERYMNSAKNQIYHIDDIQTLRAVRNYVADKYGQANGLNDLDSMTPDEQEARIKDVYDGHLSTFAKFLNEEANIIAGKTSLMDRSVEGIFGRRAMQVLNTINTQVGRNMVGFNIGSAGTNFLPIAQAMAKLRKRDMIKAFSQTISNKFNSDGFVENDPTLIRRKGADRFAKTPWEKASDIGYVLMSAVDNLTSEVIVRAKYNELTRNGLDSEQAHIKAGEWASRLMGDRSLGQMPQLFNSKTLGIFTKFQLEVRNQLDSMFYDSFHEAKEGAENIADVKERNAKTAAKVASTLAQLMVFQHIFGMVFEQIAGYNPTFDILSTLATLFGWDDEEESEDTLGDNLQQAFNELLDDLPYTSTFTGGRIPISAALPIEELLTGKDEWGNEVSRLETFAEAAPYYALPTGYGQLKKTRDGLRMFSDEHPIAGSYTDSGNLRFPVEETPINIAQAAVFGQYANKNARDYFDNEYAPLTPDQVEEFMATGMSYSEYSKKKKAKKIKEAKAKELIYSIVGGEDVYHEYTDAINEIKAGVYVDRKTRVLGYLNSLDIDYATKLILYKKEFPNDNRFNVALVNHLNEMDDISYSEMEAILTELGFQVDEDGNIKW
jgi:hypothetical protein